MITFEINQEIVPPRHRLKERRLSKLFRSIKKYVKMPRRASVSMAFVHDKTMRGLNRVWRGKDKVTDILSFSSPLPAPYRACSGTGMGDDERGGEFMGELVLAWPFVRKQAEEHGKTLEQELALLIAHGVLHLRGYDHETKKDTRKMLPLQNKILADFYGKDA